MIIMEFHLVISCFLLSFVAWTVDATGLLLSHEELRPTSQEALARQLDQESYPNGASCGVIIPEELPSLLSVAYSNIPPIKKGTDSRIGFGFAFGNHADFQIMLELGPQTNTMNLTGQPFPKNSNNKRQAPSPPPAKINKNREKFLQTEAGNYLQNWAQKMKNPQKPVKRPASRPGDVMNLEDSMVELVKNGKGEYEIHQPKPGHMPQYVLDNLKRLYGEKKEEAKKLTEKKRSEAEIMKITEDLSDVDLD